MIKGRERSIKKEVKSEDLRRNREKAQRCHEVGKQKNKVSLPKYTNYHALNALQYHIYAATDKNLFRKPKEIRVNRSCRDVKKNCAYDIIQ